MCICRRNATHQALAAEHKRREQARHALEAITSEMVPEWLGSGGRLTANQRRFLTHALDLYKDFARDADTDEAGRAWVADAQLRVYQLQRYLGQNDQALQTLEQSQQSWKRLASEAPDKPEYGRSLALVYWSRSVVLREKKQFAEVEECAQRAVSLGQRLLKEHGLDPKTENQLCDSLKYAGHHCATKPRGKRS